MQQIIDFTWKIIEPEKKYIPMVYINELAGYRVNELESNRVDELIKIELPGFNFNYKLSEKRYCTGFSDEKGYHRCKLAEPSTGLGKSLPKLSYTACNVCESIIGFKTAFLFGNEPNENMKRHLSQPHYIYLAYFEPGLIKVGTAAENRLAKRPIEQDALLYAYIAKSDGFNIQKLEKAISKQINITQSVRSSHKLKFLDNKIDIIKGKSMILDSFRKIKDTFTAGEFEHWLVEDPKVIDLSELPEIYYPSDEVFVLEDYSYLSGKFLGIRGRYLFLNNYDNIVAVDIKSLIGRTVEFIDDYRYSFQESEQVNLFGD